VAALVPLSMMLGMFMIDNLLNDMFNPVMLLSAGGLTGLVPSAAWREDRRRRGHRWMCPPGRGPEVAVSKTPRPSSAKQTARRGSLWTLGGYGVSQVIRLASSLILARLLFPEAFGLMALVNVFMQGLEMLSDLGIGPGIIQNKRGAEPKFLRTAWTLQIIRGFVLWGITLLLARPVAAFFAARDPLASQLTTCCRWPA
jgi:hypothetical protein